jgi:hypothetical protein
MMRQAMWVAVFAMAGAGVAAAQEDRKLEDLRKEFERSMKGLQEKFEAERARLEKEFKAAREKLTGPKGEPRKGEEKKSEAKPSLEQLVEKLIDRVDRLEKKLEGLGGLGRAFGRDFDFKQFRNFKDWEEFMPPRFREFMPRGKKEEEKEFRFEFRVPPGQKKKDGDDEEKKEEKKDEKKKDEKKKDKKKGEEDSF